VQTLLGRPIGDLMARGKTRSVEDLLDMCRRRALANDQVLGDLPIGQSIFDQDRDLSLA
jgi:hypothetical protein